MELNPLEVCWKHAAKVLASMEELHVPLFAKISREVRRVVLNEHIKVVLKVYSCPLKSDELGMSMPVLGIGKSCHFVCDILI